MTGVTPDSLLLSWTVAQGPFDSFVVQYKDAQGQPRAVPVGGDQNELTVSGLESNRKYKMNLYGLRGRRRVGPASVMAKTGESEPRGPPSPAHQAPPSLQLLFCQSLALCLPDCVPVLQAGGSSPSLQLRISPGSAPILVPLTWTPPPHTLQAALPKSSLRPSSDPAPSPSPHCCCLQRWQAQGTRAPPSPEAACFRPCTRAPAPPCWAPCQAEAGLHSC